MLKFKIAILTDAKRLILVQQFILNTRSLDSMQEDVNVMAVFRLVMGYLMYMKTILSLGYARRWFT